MGCCPIYLDLPYFILYFRYIRVFTSLAKFVHTHFILADTFPFQFIRP